jgi:uncharacterized membrane protein
MGRVANLAGISMAAIAAVPGFLDWLDIPSDANAKRVGFFHMIFNVAALGLFGAGFLFQKNHWDKPSNVGLSTGLCISGFIVTCIAGYLGGSLIQKYHIGIDKNEESIKL